MEKYSGGRREEVCRAVRKEKLEVVLGGVAWLVVVVVVDGCHKIKESKSGVTQALKSFSVSARVGLTETTVQNRYEELWCLLDWANPACLGSLDHFKQEFSQPMTRGFRQDASKYELATARKKQKTLNSLKSNWMIRRTKESEISDQLPKKTDQIIFCGLSEFQQAVFSFLLSHPDTGRVLSAWDPCPCGSRNAAGRREIQSRCCFHQKDNPNSPQVHMNEDISDLSTVRFVCVQVVLLQLIAIFLKVANHASLILPNHKTSAAQARIGEVICRAVAATFPELSRRNFLSLSDPKYSGKMEVLAGLLPALEAEGDKVLLYSCSTALLDVLEAYVESVGYFYCRLDGTTNTQKRQQIVDKFNNDPSIFLFLISTKAGGLGLNITGANSVIIFDPNWNPSYDLQAQVLLDICLISLGVFTFYMCIAGPGISAGTDQVSPSPCPLNIEKSSSLSSSLPTLSHSPLLQGRARVPAGIGRLHRGEGLLAAVVQAAAGRLQRGRLHC